MHVIFLVEVLDITVLDVVHYNGTGSGAAL